MNKIPTYSAAALLACILTFGLPGQALAATTVDLNTADNFAVLAGTAVTNVPTSTITGDVGLSPASGSNYVGVTPAQVSGTIYAVDSAGPAGSVNNPALLTTAKNDLTAAYLDAAGRTPDTTFATTDNQLGGQTLTPGVYAVPAASTANLIGTLTLDGQNNANAVFIFQSSSSLVTAANSIVELINGTQPCNVFWQVASSATLGANSTFKGNILALTSATVNSGANVEGSVLVRNAAVTLNANTITDSACTTATPTPPPTPTTPGSGAGNSTATANSTPLASLADASSGVALADTADALPDAGSSGVLPLATMLTLAGLWYGRRQVRQP